MAFSGEKLLLGKSVMLGEVFGRVDPGTEVSKGGERFRVAGRHDRDLIPGVVKEVVSYDLQRWEDGQWGSYLSQWGNATPVDADFKVTKRVHPKDASLIERGINNLRDVVLR